jgi:hypothetical protein
MVKTQNWLLILENCILGLELVLLIFREQPIKVSYTWPLLHNLFLQKRENHPTLVPTIKASIRK